MALAVAELCTFAVWLSKERNADAAKDTLLELALEFVPAVHDGARSEAQGMSNGMADHRKAFSKATGVSTSIFSDAPAPQGSVKSGMLAQMLLNRS